jgi:hypothetical protein
MDVHVRARAMEMAHATRKAINMPMLKADNTIAALSK